MTFLCRTSTIHHKASGIEVQTPLLVPSFSSKGFSYSRADGKSEIRGIIRTCSEFITDVCLLSAYDIFYGHVQPAGELPLRAELTFIDSGGYEVSRDRDYSAVIDAGPCPDAWDREKLESVYDSWPDELPAVFVNYDHPDERRPLAEQTCAAIELLGQYENHNNLFLLKPETRSQRTVKETLKRLRSDPSPARSFDLIGVTEKELGNSILDRMQQIALLRLALDEAHVPTPIHVFGALDPLSVQLYFIAGAEVFDGLTWLRYGYRRACSMYVHDKGALDYGIHVPQNLVRARIIADNYYEISRLREQMITFESTRQFDKLAPHEGLLRDAHDQLMARLKKAVA